MKAQKIALTALLAASLVAGKEALGFIPNVEIITLCIAVYGAVFGMGISFAAVLIFCALEGFLYGFGYWLLLYITYWPFVAVVFSLIAKRSERLVWFALAAVALTIFFGVWSTALDTFFMTAKPTLRFFGIRYFNGAPFFITHIICNAIVFPTAFVPLRDAVKRISTKTK
ncbi:MAG: hypothetical protein LBT20_04070 [Clostridiales bacterium]|jgi:hypothetical protein|nr:hypothetical protein [Clostridiales bacterium]